MKSAILSLLSLACVAQEYKLNEIEQLALDCIQYTYDQTSTKQGSLKVDCTRDRNDRLQLRQIDIASTSLESLGLTEGRKCKSKSSDPYFLKGGLMCARKLLTAHCNWQTTKTEQNENIQQLIGNIKPDWQACLPLYRLTKLEEMAVECIRHAVTDVSGAKRSLRIYCPKGNVAQLESLAGWVDSYVGALDFKKGGKCSPGIVRGRDNADKAIECATLMLQQACGYKTINGGNKEDGDLDGLIEEVTPKEKRVCGKDL